MINRISTLIINLIHSLSLMYYRIQIKILYFLGILILSNSFAVASITVSVDSRSNNYTNPVSSSLEAGDYNVSVVGGTWSAWSNLDRWTTDVHVSTVLSGSGTHLPSLWYPTQGEASANSAKGTICLPIDDTVLVYIGDGPLSDNRGSLSVLFEKIEDIIIIFPPLDENQSVVFLWNPPEDKAQECDEERGLIQEAIENCSSTYRCVVTEECEQDNTSFPPKVDNEAVLFTWHENSDRSNECLLYNGHVQKSRVDCSDTYRCVAETEEPNKECNEDINSYVSPSNGTFHEDITLTGTNFGLHYSSGNVDENQSKTIAYGWSFSNHATLTEDKLYLGSGSLWIVERTQEGNLTIVKSGSSEMLFDTEGLHLHTRDLYTKEIETTFDYDEEARLITVTNRYSEITTINRDNNGTIISIEAPHGQITYLAIDENSDLIEVQYEDTTSYTFEYEKHLMILEREPNGNEFLHFFDDQGKVVKVIDAEQGEWDFGTTSDSSSGTHTVTRASGDVITYTNHFLEDGMLKTEKTLPTGDIVLYSHSVDDSISSTTTCGQTNTNTYKLENAVLAKDPLQDKRILQSSTQTTPSGLSKITNYTTNYSFDANQTLIAVENTTNTNGATTTSLRDYNQSRLTLTYANGIVTETLFDTRTQLPLEVQYANFKPTFYSYDDKGRVIQSKQGRRIMRYAYNDNGNIEEEHNVQRDTKTLYSYDLRDRVIQTTYADGTTEHYEYDSNGNLITRTVPTPADYTFTYNGVNKRVSTNSPLQKQTTYTYDKQRRVTKVTKPSGKAIDTIYTNGRVTAITTPEATTNYSYACQSNMSNITKGSENFSFTYDGTLVTSIVQSGTLNQTLNYSYNNDFRLNSFTYADKTEDYSYDLDGLLTQSGEFNISRDAENGLTTQISDGTLNIAQSYNKFGELKTKKDNVHKLKLKRTQARISKTNDLLITLVPKKNGKGFKKKKKRTIKHFSYDTRDRLIEVRVGKNAEELVEEYTYDNNGNRASATVYGVTTTASYTLDDNLVVYGDNTYLYDDDGYLQTKTTPEGSTAYTYGTIGEHLEVATPTKTISYQHNANNQRVAKLIDNEIVEKYLWADLTTLLAVYDADDNIKQRFEYADSRMPLSMTDSNGTKYYLHYNQVGTLRAVSRVLSPDNTFEVIKEITYDTYGNILTDSNPTFKVPFGFAGGLYDVDTKLTRFGYRDYDAYTGKWTAKDPIGFDGGDSNLYGYVLGDPVSGFDPMGLFYSPKFEHKNTNNGCVQKCVNKRAGELGAILGLTPLLNLKNDNNKIPFGGGSGNKSPWTSIDKKWPSFPGSNTNGGFKQPVGTGSRVKPVGTLGTASWLLGGFGLGYAIGTIGDCIYECSKENECQ